MEKSNIADNLKSIREKRNLTQYQMAEILKTSRAAYSHYESGKRTPSIEMLTKISNTFEIPFNELIGQTDKWLLSGTKRLRKTPKQISNEKAFSITCELLDYAGLDFALTTEEIKRITQITKSLHQALINDIRENTTDIIL